MTINKLFKDWPALKLLAAAILFVFAFLSGNWLPAFEFFRWLIPLATLAALFYFSRKEVVLLLFVCLATIALVPGLVFREILLSHFLLNYLTPGIILYFLLRRNFNGYRLIALATVSYLLISSTGYYFLSFFSRQSFLQIVVGGQQTIEQMALEISQQSKYAPFQEAKVVSKYLLLFLPSSLFIQALFLNLFTVWLAEPVLRKLKIKSKQLNIQTFVLPEKMIWLLIASMILAAFELGPSRIIGANLLLVLLAIYLFQGLAILSHYFSRLPLTPGLRLILLLAVILFMLPLIMVVSAFLGLLDFYFDFRKLKVKKGENNESNPT